MKIKEEYNLKSPSNSCTSSSENAYLLDVGHFNIDAGHFNIDASSSFVSFSRAMVGN